MKNKAGHKFAVRNGSKTLCAFSTFNEAHSWALAHAHAHGRLHVSGTRRNMPSYIVTLIPDGAACKEIWLEPSYSAQAKAATPVL